MICSCSLSGTNACLNCSNYLSQLGPKYYEQLPTHKEIIEKFDDKGNLIERITKL